MRVLFACVKNDYDEPGRGESFEYVNFHGTLSRMAGVQVDFFDTGNQGRKRLIPGKSRELHEKAVEGGYDLLFFFAATDEIEFEAIRKITEHGRTKTLCWFADDHWRFDSYSSKVCRAFDHVVTTDEVAFRRYAEIGYGNAIRSQWGYNHFLQPERLPVRHDVTFVGQRYGKRIAQIEALRASGLPFRCFGYGWNVGKATHYRNVAARIMGMKRWIANEGRVSFREMLSIFASSRINLNFSDSSAPGRKQIKARNFEVTGAGGFLLTEEAEGLERYFDVGREIETFRDMGELVEKARYYLAHEGEMVAVAAAGRKRTLEDHTYQKRFERIFDAVAAGRGK